MVKEGICYERKIRVGGREGVEWGERKGEGGTRERERERERQRERKRKLNVGEKSSERLHDRDRG